MNGENRVDSTLFQRIRREFDKPVSITTIPPDAPLDRPLIAVVSSRLGLDRGVHQQACRFLARSMLDCRARNGVLLIADGSAIDPWATRAAELFGIPVLRVFVNTQPDVSLSDRNETRVFVVSTDGSQPCRDRTVIALADRVDAVYLRKGGKIASALRHRIGSRHDATTRVAVSSEDNGAALSLIAAGAIGWVCVPLRTCGDDGRLDFVGHAQRVSGTRLDWAATDGQWLVHHTRGCVGAWPGETEQQYRDAMLLGDGSVTPRGPLQALARIVRGRRLVASAIATERRFRVVCFSASPLRERLRSRCYRPHLKRWDAEPYGVAIRVAAAQRIGAMPVVYGDPELRDRMEPDDRYRFQSVGKTYDWTKEREWRVLGDVDLSVCRQDDVRVFVPSTADADTIQAWCPWEIARVEPLFCSHAIMSREKAENVF